MAQDPDRGKRVQTVTFGYQAQVRRCLMWFNVGPVFSDHRQAWNYLDGKS